MSIVSNSAPLINLDAVGALNLLNRLYGTIIIPQAVYQEVVIAGAGRPGAQTVANAGWIQVQSVKNMRAVSQMVNAAKLGRGECEAISLAQELGAALILLDDLDARRYAHQQKLPVMGTVGVLLLAKQQSLIPLVRPYLNALIAAGMFIDSSLYRLALRIAGE